MTVEKPKPKQLLRPITTEANSAMNQSQFLAITCNSLEAREKSRVHGAIDFGFDSHWLKNWRESFKPISKRSNRNHVITFDSHLKTALTFLLNANHTLHECCHQGVAAYECHLCPARVDHPCLESNAAGLDTVKLGKSRSGNLARWNLFHLAPL